MLDFCCPLCKGPLRSDSGGYHCPRCERDYPVVSGIPDFRVFPDPYIDIEGDWQKGGQLAEAAARKDFCRLLEHYWSITPGVPEDLARNYMRHDLTGIERGRQTLRASEAAQENLRVEAGVRVLELGCRTGGFLVAAAERGATVVGADIAFRWLVIGRKRLEEMGHSSQLVCCCAQFLPFQDAAFDLLVAGNVIEHTADQEKLLQEAYRTLRPGGVFYAVTCNRFSIAAEPHVRVWGVGWMPRRWMDPYVRRVRGIPYEHVRLLSIFELKRILRRTPFVTGRVDLPAFSDGELEGLAAPEKRLAAFYNRVKDWPIIRLLLLVFGPVFDFVCIRAADKPRSHSAAAPQPEINRRELRPQRKTNKQNSP